MFDILHRVGIEASPAKVYQALATPEGIAGWWTVETIFLTSLKSLVETGKGQPSPNDVRIGNWH